jgi:hypothetical protein
MYPCHPRFHRGLIDEDGEDRMGRYGEAEHPTQSFVLRVWIEEPARDGSRTTWRGHITHVQTGERRSVGSIADVHRFLAEHLGALGVRFRAADRIRMLLMRTR